MVIKPKYRKSNFYWKLRIDTKLQLATGSHHLFDIYLHIILFPGLAQRIHYCF